MLTFEECTTQVEESVAMAEDKAWRVCEELRESYDPLCRYFPIGEVSVAAIARELHGVTRRSQRATGEYLVAPYFARATLTTHEEAIVLRGIGLWHRNCDNQETCNDGTIT